MGFTKGVMRDDKDKHTVLTFGFIIVPENPILKIIKIGMKNKATNTRCSVHVASAL